MPNQTTSKKKDTVATEIKAEIEASEVTVKAETPKAKTLADAQAVKKQVYQQYRNEDKVSIYLSPTYQAYFGNVMPITINGITIFFPVDGSTHDVPKTFADEITAKRVAIDAIINKTGKMADIASNVESTPGELELI